MRWILDANSLIYLVKADLTQRFLDLADFDVVIDTSVYKEAVEDGRARGFSDADQVDEFLVEHNIPIIPTNIESEISYFRDAGETSCCALSKKNGACVTNDIRATKKLRGRQIQVISLEIFFVNKYSNDLISEEELDYILEKLMHVNAVSPEKKMFILKKVREAKLDHE